MVLPSSQRGGRALHCVHYKHGPPTSSYSTFGKDVLHLISMLCLWKVCSAFGKYALPLEMMFYLWKVCSAFWKVCTTFEKYVLPLISMNCLVSTTAWTLESKPLILKSGTLCENPGTFYRLRNNSLEQNKDPGKSQVWNRINIEEQLKFGTV